MKRKTVSVYGYGRFGRLWAGILAENHHVKVYSRRGLTEQEVPENIEIADSKSIFNCDAIFFCIAISAFEPFLSENKHLFKSNVTYFDTCSVKVYPVEWMKKYLPEEAEIIATHPMFGPDSYPDSDEKLPIVMSNVKTKEDHFNQWKDYFSTKKMRVEEMSPEEHDKMVAYSQGITHYVGRVLADINLKQSSISTLGYNKLLEIIEQTCNDTWQLFTDLQRFNPYTQNMRKDLNESHKKIYQYLKFNGK